MNQRKVYIIRIPKKLTEVYRVVATSKEEAIELMAMLGEQLSNENEMDTGSAMVEETDNEVLPWD